MGYLDSSQTVDAVLTKKGREILARGGNLDITHFSATDTELIIDFGIQTIQVVLHFMVKLLRTYQTLKQMFILNIH